ncbi:MAG: hypothetical protein R3E18_05440 [Sphingomonadaceae bacterium]|nr:hypothetical protein [Sphingomonadaceae bacterium]
MELRNYLTRIAERAESYFQQHLAKEDLARVDKLEGLARQATDIEALQKEALYTGWTPGDLRTGELKEVLFPLFAAMFNHVRDESGDSDRALMQAWIAFHEERIKVLIHCL